MNKNEPSTYNDGLPDSLSDSDSDRYMGTRVSAETHPMNYGYSPEPQMQMPMSQMQMPHQGMQMPMQMPQQGMTTDMPYQGMPMPQMQMPMQLQQQDPMPQSYAMSGGARKGYTDLGSMKQFFF